MKSTSVRCWRPPKLPNFSCFLHFARWFWNQIWIQARKKRHRNEQEMKEELLTSNYFPYSLSEHQKTLTSSSADPGAESKGKHWVRHSTFYTLHTMWDIWAIMTASFLLQLTEELGSPCSRKDNVTGCRRTSRALLGKQILSWSKLCSSQGTWHSVFPRRCDLLHNRALSPCSQVNKLGKDLPRCFAGLQ